MSSTISSGRCRLIIQVAIIFWRVLLLTEELVIEVESCSEFHNDECQRCVANEEMRRSFGLTLPLRLPPLSFFLFSVLICLDIYCKVQPLQMPPETCSPALIPTRKDPIAVSNNAPCRFILAAFFPLDFFEKVPHFALTAALAGLTGMSIVTIIEGTVRMERRGCQIPPPFCCKSNFKQDFFFFTRLFLI